MYVWERASRGRQSSDSQNKAYKLQCSTLPKAIFTSIVAFDSHKTPGRYETSGNRFLLPAIEIYPEVLPNYNSYVVGIGLKGRS